MFLGIIGISYAWFSATVKNEAVKDQVVTTGTLKLTYTDGAEIKLVNARPGATAKKTITVKNTGSLDADYNLVWQVLKNEITNDEMVMSLTCQRLNKEEKEEESCEGLDETPIKENIVLEARNIPSGYSHVYELTVTFKETNSAQNYNQGKSFTGVLGVDEYKDTSPQPVLRAYDGTSTDGATFTKGIYKYSYSGVLKGWRVELNNKKSSDPVTEAPCSQINDDQVVSYSSLFGTSSATSIDLSKFYTNNIIDMYGMFWGTKATEIKGFDKIDTSNVKDMSYMFDDCGVSSLDISGLDTSNVTNMEAMFAGLTATEIKGLDGFNTSKVTNMNNMFGGSKLTTLDVSSFDTSKVNSMEYMFQNVTLEETKGLERFDTSNVWSMRSMFENSKSLSKLDLSSFNTSKVDDMRYMFYNADHLFTIYASENFTVASNVASDDMFLGCIMLSGNYTSYSESHVDAEYARISTMNVNGYFTAK